MLKIEIESLLRNSIDNKNKVLKKIKEIVVLTETNRLKDKKRGKNKDKSKGKESRKPKNRDKKKEKEKDKKQGRKMLKTKVLKNLMKRSLIN